MAPICMRQSCVAIVILLLAEFETFFLTKRTLQGVRDQIAEGDPTRKNPCA